jgi:high-affinity Fe2+/Pb2+ permease
MGETALELHKTGNWKPRVLVIGAVVGALVGTAAAYLIVQNAKEDAPPKFNAGQGVKLGVLVLGLLRSIASLKD